MTLQWSCLAWRLCELKEPSSRPVLRSGLPPPLPPLLARPPPADSSSPYRQRYPEESPKKDVQGSHTSGGRTYGKQICRRVPRLGLIRKKSGGRLSDLHLRTKPHTCEQARWVPSSTSIHPARAGQRAPRTHLPATSHAVVAAMPRCTPLNRRRKFQACPCRDETSCRMRGTQGRRSILALMP